MTETHREDAIWHQGRYYVPTTEGTVWVDTWERFRAVGGVVCFSEDKTTIELQLPPGHKFSIRFQHLD